VGPFDPRRKNSAVSHREEGKPSERSCRATGADDRLFVVAQATFAGVSMIDTHILGWFAKQVKQLKVFSLNASIPNSCRRAIVGMNFLCRGVGIDDESDQVP